MHSFRKRLLSRQSSSESSSCSTRDDKTISKQDGVKPNESEGTDGSRTKQKPNRTVSVDMGRKLGRHLSLNMNNMTAIKIKMLFFMLSVLSCCICFVQAGFFTFYFPNLFKPKGYDELTDMISNVQQRIFEAQDAFSDAQYFWGLLQEHDRLDGESIYPEESTCSEVFPMFRDLAIQYAYIDFEYYVRPLESYKQYLEEFRNRWYPLGGDSRAALPRVWEQDLIKRELEIRIKWMTELTKDKVNLDIRDKLIEIWKNVRRSLDNSVSCLYLRYAYRQIAEDLNQVALETNLEGMQEAMKMIESAYKRIEYYQSSDDKIMSEVNEEIIKFDRFTINVDSS